MSRNILATRSIAFETVLVGVICLFLAFRHVDRFVGCPTRDADRASFSVTIAG